MAKGETGEQMLLSLPASHGDRCWALAAAVVSLAVLALLVPFARVPLPRLDAFIPCYESALLVSDLITATLLIGQFVIGGPRALLAVGSGYLFTALIAVAHALTFPGLFAETGLLGAGPQSTAWLYMFWHAGFPIAILAYALLNDGRRARGNPMPAVLGSIGAVIVLVSGLTWLATAGAGALPAIMRGSHYSPAMLGISVAVWGLSLLGLGVLAAQRPYAVLDVWLMAVLCVWLCDIALSVVLNGGRFDLGFYAGRIYGLFAANCVLAVLLLETLSLHVRLARSVHAERQQREQRLAEMHAQLVHLCG